MGQATQAGRFSNSNGTTCPMPMGGVSANVNEFDNLDRYFRVQRAPEHFKDLEEKVTSRMVASQLPFQYHADFLRATADTDLVPITIQLRNRDLTFRSNRGSRRFWTCTPVSPIPEGASFTRSKRSSLAIFPNRCSRRRKSCIPFTRSPFRFARVSAAWIS